METLQPWNKDRIIGQKLPLKLKEFGLSGLDCSCRIKYGNWLYLI